MKRVLIFLLSVGVAFSFEECFLSAGKRYGVPPELLIAIAVVESGGRVNALNKNRNGTYDVGLMQINTDNYLLLRRAGIIKSLKELWNPCKNIYAGAYILRQCINKYGLTWKGVDCYNKGRRARSASRYVNKVYSVLRRLRR